MKAACFSVVYADSERQAAFCRRRNLPGEGSDHLIHELLASVAAQRGRAECVLHLQREPREGEDVPDGTEAVLTRYYIGGRYELDMADGTTEERLYLDGDAYSAPMVMVRESGSGWKLLNIGRDHLGSVTHLATYDGTLVAEYSYDAWGRLRDPETQEIYGSGEESELLLGRGFTGHEHLPWFGLVNMNARLYDPALGRFLSPDPYIQLPDFTQNFNRYSYCLNNPLIFADESEEFFVLDSFIAGLFIGGWDKAVQMAKNDLRYGVVYLHQIQINLLWEEFGRWYQGLYGSRYKLLAAF